MKAYAEVAEFIAKCAPREVSEFEPSPEVRQRIWELVEREKTAGSLAEDRRELDRYESLDLLMNLAKVHARRWLVLKQ